MSSNKGKKTDLVAYWTMAMATIIIIASYVMSLDLTTIGASLGALAVISNILTSKLSKDKDSSHSPGSIGGEDPDDDDEEADA